jgi:hypothetical protein
VHDDNNNEKILIKKKKKKITNKNNKRNKRLEKKGVRDPASESVAMMLSRPRERNIRPGRNLMSTADDARRVL